MEGRQSSNFFVTMIERAKEELDKLEAQHPNRFEYLKHELKSFISLSTHHHHHALLTEQCCDDHLQPLPTTSAATTQASTSRVRRKRQRCSVPRKRALPSEEKEKDELLVMQKEEKRKTKKKMMNGAGTGKGMEGEMDRVDIALERARACIQKIHDLKVQLFIY